MVTINPTQITQRKCNLNITHTLYKHGSHKILRPTVNYDNVAPECLQGCQVGIPDGRDLTTTNLDDLQWNDVYTKCHN